MKPVATTPAAKSGGERIAKVLARAGLCSRRDAERWIAAGRVAVNGAVLSSPAVNVGADDEIAVDGQPLPERERTRLWLYHKPKGLVTTARDPQGRPTVFAALPPGLPRVVAVGRLDINTEGLLLLTNDGGLARMLELPSTGWLRRYRIRAHGAVTQGDLDSLREGVTIDGILYSVVEASLDRVQGSNLWLTLALREGKNREVKRLLAHLGLFTTRLIRVSYGPFQLGELPEGQVVEIRGRVLRDQLGAKLAAAAGADFAAPIRPLPKPEPPAPERPAKRGHERAMRIVGGEFRGRPLASPSGRATRPTADRLRQTLFDILAHAHGDPVAGARVLDLFAGTGALGLEALSRGAAYALFVEDAVEARGVIRANIETFGLTGRTRIFRRDAMRLGPAGTVAPFDLVFADPPYGKGLGEKALASALAGGWLAPGALAVLEDDAAAGFAPVAGLAVVDTRSIGGTRLMFLRAGVGATG